ncbi:transposase [Robertkochia flava]|uniref:transposase n=1 Tax=Robertkochia flava TaxID=3447986 RepID=UPI001CD01EB4|nr:transposase [Robertkochia marina]
MKASLGKIRKSRHYSEDFKKQLVSEFESGKFSVLELSRLHGMPFQTIYKWIYKYSHFNKHGYRVIEMKDSSQQKIKELEQKIKMLERTVGQKQILIDYLEKMMEIAKEELDIDIKKNYSTPRSAGSGNTPKK